MTSISIRICVVVVTVATVVAVVALLSGFAASKVSLTIGYNL